MSGAKQIFAASHARLPLAMALSLALCICVSSEPSMLVPRQLAQMVLKGMILGQVWCGKM